MTRKDYILIADAIKQTGAYHKDNQSALDALNFLTGYLGAKLEAQNASFNYTTFRVAAGVMGTNTKRMKGFIEGLSPEGGK